MWRLTCPSRSSQEMRRTCTGPGPQCATGGETVVVRRGSAASGTCSATGGNVRVTLTCTGLEAILLKPCTEPHAHAQQREGEQDNTRAWQTVKRPDSVRFQKDFQKFMSRFWVMRSNSAPRSSGSMTYLADVRRERAAKPRKRSTSGEAAAGQDLRRRVAGLT